MPRLEELKAAAALAADAAIWVYEDEIKKIQTETDDEEDFDECAEEYWEEVSKKPNPEEVELVCLSHWKR
jgi:GTPase SAR1 family protein